VTLFCIYSRYWHWLKDVAGTKKVRATHFKEKIKKKTPIFGEKYDLIIHIKGVLWNLGKMNTNILHNNTDLPTGYLRSKRIFIGTNISILTL
jgi:hypothetical protein